MTLTDPCPDCGGPMTQVRAWGPPRRDLGAFCEACMPASGSAVLPSEFRAGVGARLDAAFTDLLAGVRATPPTPPSGEEVWANIRRLMEPSATLVTRPDRAGQIRRAVGDAGLGLSVRVVESEFVPDGEALVIDHAAVDEAVRAGLRAAPGHRDDELRSAAARVVAQGRAVKVTGDRGRGEAIPMGDG